MFELQEGDIRVVKITDDTISLQGRSLERLKYEVCCSCFHLSREMAVGMCSKVGSGSDAQENNQPRCKMKWISVETTNWDIALAFACRLNMA